MRRWMPVVTMGICLALLGGSAIGYAAGCAAETKAKDAALDALAKAYEAYTNAMGALATATTNLVNAQRDFIMASVSDSFAFSDAGYVDRMWQTCIETKMPDCSYWVQARQDAQKKITKAESDVARANDRMQAAAKAANAAATAAEEQRKKKEAARAAYEAALNAWTKCVDALPKPPPPPPKSNKSPRV